MPEGRHSPLFFPIEDNERFSLVMAAAVVNLSVSARLHVPFRPSFLTFFDYRSLFFILFCIFA